MTDYPPINRPVVLRILDAIVRLAEAEEQRNVLLDRDIDARRESWAQSQDQSAAALAALRINPVDWLEDGEYDRLFWAIARAKGRPGRSTTEDEDLGRAIIRELRAMR